MVITVLGLIISFLILNQPQCYPAIYEPTTGWDRGSEIDIFFSVWGGRIFAFALLGLVAYIIKSFYDYVRTTSRDTTEIEIEKEKTEQSRLAFEPTQRAQFIPFNTKNKIVYSSGKIKLTENLELTKDQLSSFVTNSIDGDIGLTISRWKREGWEQEVLERLLDYLHSIELVTERTNGRACVYTGDYTPEYVLRVISQHAISIE